MFANNEMAYDEQTILSDLDLIFNGTVYALKENYKMYRLYQKNEINFSLAWIIAYVVLPSVSDNLSASLGIAKRSSPRLCVSFLLCFFFSLSKSITCGNDTACVLSPKDYLYFIPLVLIVGLRFRNGVTMNASVTETLLHI